MLYTNIVPNETVFWSEDEMLEDMRKLLCRVLTNTFLFSGVSPEEVETATPFLSECVFSVYSDKTTIQSTRAPIDGIAVITDGEAEVLSDASDTGILLRTICTGGLFGAASLYTTAQHYETVIRAKGDCQLLIIPEATVKRLISANSRLAENYIRFLSERICFLNQKITAFTAGSAEAKLAVYLSDLPDAGNGTRRLTMSLSALADSLGMGRASLYRALCGFEERGIISRDGKNFHIIDEDALTAIFRKN